MDGVVRVPLSQDYQCVTPGKLRDALMMGGGGVGGAGGGGRGAFTGIILRSEDTRIKGEGRSQLISTSYFTSLAKYTTGFS